MTLHPPTSSLHPPRPYILLHPLHPPVLYLTGFGIDVKDGHVIRWSPITGMTGNPASAGGSQGSFGEHSFQIFLAADCLSKLVNTVESQGSADASGLEAPPNMAFKGKVFAGKSDSERPDEQTVILIVSDEAASKLRELTENNFGKRLLIVCRNRVIAAPEISAPLASRQLMFSVTNSAVLDSLRSQ